MKPSKLIIKIGLPFCIIMTMFYGIMFLVIGSDFGRDFGYTFSGIIVAIIAILIVGLPLGVATSFFFVLLMGILVKIQEKKFASFRDEFSKEHDVLCDDGATYFMGKERGYSWIFMTHTGLFFKSDKISIQNHGIWIYFDDIKSVSVVKLMKFSFSTALLIEKNDGSKYKFMLDDNEAWALKIIKIKKLLATDLKS